MLNPQKFSKSSKCKKKIPAACGMVFRRVELLGGWDFCVLFYFSKWQTSKLISWNLTLILHINSENSWIVWNFANKISKFQDFWFFFQDFWNFLRFLIISSILLWQKSTWLRLVVCKTWFYLLARIKSKFSVLVTLWIVKPDDCLLLSGWGIINESRNMDIEFAWETGSLWVWKGTIVVTQFCQLTYGSLLKANT